MFNSNAHLVHNKFNIHLMHIISDTAINPGGGTHYMFGVMGRLSPFDPPFSTYVKFDPYF